MDENVANAPDNANVANAPDNEWWCYGPGGGGMMMMGESGEPMMKHDRGWK